MTHEDPTHVSILFGYMCTHLISLSGMTESSLDDRPRHHILALYGIWCWTQVCESPQYTGVKNSFHNSTHAIREVEPVLRLVAYALRARDRSIDHRVPSSHLNRVLCRHEAQDT